MQNSTLKNTGKIAKLRMNLQQKCSELLAILVEKDKLANSIGPKLIYDYELLFGKFEDELKEKNTIAQIYENEMSELIVKLKRGEKISKTTIQNINKNINSRIKNSHQKQEKESFEFYDDKYQGLIQDKKSNSETEINKIFRELVKSIHPDCATNFIFDSHWDSVIDAYKAKDLNRLKVYHSLISKDHIDTEYSNNPLNNLEKELIQTQRCIDYEKRKIGRTLEEEPYSFLEKLKDKAWQKEREQLIRSKIIETNKMMELAQRILKDLAEGKIADVEEESEKQFQSEFIDNTYFKY